MCLRQNVVHHGMLRPGDGTKCKDPIKQVLFLSEVHASSLRLALDLTTGDLTSQIQYDANYECLQNWEQEVTVPPDR